MICYDNIADHVVLPCGHGGYCGTCASKVFKKPSQVCPVCRGALSAIVRVPVDTPIGQRAHVLVVHACGAPKPGGRDGAGGVSTGVDTEGV